MTRARFTQIPWAAWVMSRAFASNRALAVVVALAIAASSITAFGFLGIFALASVFFAIGIVTLTGRTSAFTFPVGSETPRTGPLWQVAGLAQHPGTRLSALMLARRVIRSLPPGSVVATVAASEELLDAYVRWGFTRGQCRRAFLVV